MVSAAPFPGRWRCVYGRRPLRWGSWALLFRILSPEAAARGREAGPRPSVSSRPRPRADDARVLFVVRDAIGAGPAAADVPWEKKRLIGRGHRARWRRGPLRPPGRWTLGLAGANRSFRVRAPGCCCGSLCFRPPPPRSVQPPRRQADPRRRTRVFIRRCAFYKSAAPTNRMSVGGRHLPAAGKKSSLRLLPLGDDATRHLPRSRRARGLGCGLTNPLTGPEAPVFTPLMMPLRQCTESTVLQRPRLSRGLAFTVAKPQAHRRRNATTPHIFL